MFLNKGGNTLKRKYTIFQQHVNNALEKVHGEHLNIIQGAVNDMQSDITEVYNKNFLNDCIFVLENNPCINMMFFLDFATQNDIFRAKSSGYTHVPGNNCVIANTPVAIVHSIAYKSEYSSIINEFILKADASIPVGCAIRYYISVDLKNYYPINPSMSEPYKIPMVNDTVYLKIELIKNQRGESPSLFSVALYYNDSVLRQSSSIENPSLDVLIDGDEQADNSSTTLIYLNGKLARVVEEGGATTELVFDQNGTLNSVKTTDSKSISEDTLIYGTDSEMGNDIILKAIHSNRTKTFNPERNEGETS